MRGMMRWFVAILVLGALAPISVCAAAKAKKASQSTGLANEVTQSVEWLSQRQTFVMNGHPYGLTAVPILFYSPSDGFDYGGWFEVADYRRRPYRYRLNMQWWLSTRGKRNHHIRFESPDIFGTPFSVRFITQDLKDIGAKYYGIGNNTKINKTILASNPDYYTYQLEEQKTALDIEASAGQYVSLFGGLRFDRGAPSRINEALKNGYFVFADSTLFGLASGWTNLVIGGIIVDTRNDQELPTRGMLSELSWERAFDVLGSNYVDQRLTFIHSEYFPFLGTRRFPRYILFTRFIYEWIDGTVPFYDLTELGGSVRGSEVGASAPLRGYDPRRFADSHKVYLTLELRRIFGTRTILHQHVQAQAIGFTDFGRVGKSIEDLKLSGFHSSAGAGLRLVLNSQLSIRADMAFSPEGHRFLLTFGNQL